MKSAIESVKMKLFRWIVGGMALFVGHSAFAELDLHQPIDCVLGESCLIQQFVDHDPSSSVLDFACDDVSYDGHKGTDFRVTVKDMRAGVDVLAAADGVVLGFRDGMEDRRVQSEADDAAVEGKECGNGVVLRHEDGWETQYCHLKKDSVTVQKGARVKAGDVIGQVGLSGRTQFAHLHLSVRKDGATVDPFAPEFNAASCKASSTDTLWQDEFITAFTYQPTKIVTVGLADKAPSFAGVMDGKWLDVVVKSNTPLVIYGLAVNGKAGDILTLSLEGPSGTIVNSKRPPLEKRKAQWFGFAGKKAPAEGWPRGTYVLSVAILRDGKVLHSYSDTALID
jgi:hypothetical protein